MTRSILVSDLLLHPKTKKDITSIINKPAHALIIYGQPGVGKKTAQRIVLDLKDKLGDLGFDIFAGGEGLVLQYEDAPHEEIPAGKSWIEAKEALKALGYTEAELDRAWQTLQSQVSDSEPVDSLMKKALQQLFKG